MNSPQRPSERFPTAMLVGLKRARTIMLALALATGTANGQNQTPGYGISTWPNHSAYLFAPYKWAYGDGLGVAAYTAHVCYSLSPRSGQRYSGPFSYTQTAPPSTQTPSQCTVANFYDIIHNHQEDIGTLLICTHGNRELLAIEPYSTGNAAAARVTAYTTAPGVPGCPVFATYEVFVTSCAEGGSHGFAVAVSDNFIRNYGYLGRSLVYINACGSGGLTNTFWLRDARVAIGNASFPSEAEQCSISATNFFKKMDGQRLQLDRPVSAARAGEPLVAAGLENTTLTPSVLSVSAPCPIKTGDLVVYTFDTTCDVTKTPDIVGTNCTIENEAWLSNTQLMGVCTAPPPPGAFSFTLRLRYNNLQSETNYSLLDGNTDPWMQNARGPAHDDHIQTFNCGRVACQTAYLRKSCGSQYQGCTGMFPGFFSLPLGSVVCGETWADAGQRADDWYRISVTAPSTLQVQLDSAVVPLTCSLWNGVCPTTYPISGVDYAQPGNSLTYSAVVQPGEYFIYVAPGQPSGPILNGFPCGQRTVQQEYYLSVDAGPVAACPAIDCAGALLENEPCGINVNGGCGSGPNQFVPIAPGQSVCGSVWASNGAQDSDAYLFTLTQPGTVRWTVQNGEVPLALGLISANCTPNPFATGSLERGASGEISANLPPGTYYAIVTPGTQSSGIFEGYPCPGGQYRATLTFRPPVSNDTCATATPVNSNQTIEGTTRGATPDANLPPCGTTAEAPAVWYTLTGTGHTLTASLCGGTDYDAAMSVFQGACGALTCVASDDDTCGNAPQVSWCSVPGMNYFICIYGFGQNSGDFTLHLSDDGMPCAQPVRQGACCVGQTCLIVTSSQCATSGGVFQGDLSLCILAHGLSLCNLPPPDGDMNCDGSVNLQDVAPFIQALMDPAGYSAAYPSCNSIWADMNGDMLVNGLDIQGFVAALCGL